MYATSQENVSKHNLALYLKNNTQNIIPMLIFKKKFINNFSLGESHVIKFVCTWGKNTV